MLSRARVGGPQSTARGPHSDAEQREFQAGPPMSGPGLPGVAKYLNKLGWRLLFLFLPPPPSEKKAHKVRRIDENITTTRAAEEPCPVHRVEVGGSGGNYYNASGGGGAAGNGDMALTLRLCPYGHLSAGGEVRRCKS